MSIYIGLLFFFLGIWIVLKENKYKCGRWYSVMFMTSFGVLAAIRASTVGNDTKNYLRVFNMISNGVYLDAWDERFEKGYLLLNEAVAMITQNEQVFLTIISIIVYAGFIYFIVQYSQNYFLSVFLFVTMRFFGQTMSGIRFSIAIAILLVAYDRLQKKHVMQFVILVLLATMFHKTAIIFIIVAFFKYIKCNRNVVYLWVFLTLGCYIAAPYIINFLFNIFPLYGNYADRYLTTGVSLGTLIYAIVWGSVFILGYSIQRYNRAGSEGMNELNLMMLVTVSIYVMSMYFTLLDRVAQYFGVFAIIYIPNCIHMIKDMRKRYFLSIMVMLVFMIYFVGIQILRPEWNAINLYRTFWME